MPANTHKRAKTAILTRHNSRFPPLNNCFAAHIVTYEVPIIARIQQYFGAELHKRQVESREKQIEKEKERLQEINPTREDLETKMKTVQEEYSKKFAFNKRIETEIEKMQALETPEVRYAIILAFVFVFFFKKTHTFNVFCIFNCAQPSNDCFFLQNTGVLTTLRGLVALNENLKKQETEFRQSCKQQLQELQEKIAAVKNQAPDDEEVNTLYFLMCLIEQTIETANASPPHLLLIYIFSPVEAH